MSTTYTINVTNNSPNDQDFFFFQAPAIYSGGGTVYTNSIFHKPLQPKVRSGAVLTFVCLQQYFAGAQARVQPPVVGQPSGFITASQPIDVTLASGVKSNNGTIKTVTPSLGLSPAIFTEGVKPGAFRIETPKFDPTRMKFNVGLAVKNEATGEFIMSNFIDSQPSKLIDCQPVVIFYVQTGSHLAGNSIHFATSSTNAAVCDATNGNTTFDVSYQNDGTWVVNPRLVAQ